MADTDICDMFSLKNYFHLIAFSSSGNITSSRINMKKQINMKKHLISKILD